MEASRWDECVDDRVVLKSVRRWCSKSLSSKEVSREINDMASSVHVLGIGCERPSTYR